MATLSTNPRVTTIIPASDSVGPFDIGYRVFSLTEFYVTVDGALETDWTVSADLTAGYSDTAQITFTNAQSSGSVIKVQSDLVPKRDEDYTAGPNLTENMNAELARISAYVADVRSRMINGPDNAAESAAAAAAAATLAAGYAGPHFDTVADLLADTGMTYGDYSAGDYLNVRGGGYVYEIADVNATDHDITNSAATPVKMYYRPVYVAAPQAIAAVGLLSGYPASDESATLQACLDIAAREGVPADFGGFNYRCEATLHRNGVKVIRGSGANILFPSTGTYDRWRNDADDGDISDTMTCAFDVSGDAFVFHGQITLRGVSGLNKFTTVERATVDQNLAALGGLTSAIAEMTCTGQLVCEGFAHWAYVPSTEAGFTSRQFARLNGQYRVRFCLSPFGWFGGGANGTDDNNMHLRVDRCGGYGTVTESKLNGSELNVGYFFGTGLTSKTANKDWEDTTATFTAGSDDLVLDGDGSADLDEDDFVVLLDAYQRPSDPINAPTVYDGDLIPLVAKIRAKTDDNNFKLHFKTLPNVSGSGKNWFYRPPRLSLSSGHFTGGTAYTEGYWDCIELEDNSIFSFGDLKGGGVRLSGRHGAIINTTGLNNIVEFGAHRTLGLSDGLEAAVAYGMIRYNENGIPGDEYDMPLYAHIVWPWQRAVSQPVTYELDYDAETGTFTTGLTLTGGTSGATGVIRKITDDGTTGTLRLGNVSGTFVDDETITDSSTGSATANGAATLYENPVLTPEIMPIKGVDPVEFFGSDRLSRFEYQLDYDAETGGFTAGQTLTGGTSGATATIASVTDSGTDGSLFLRDIEGIFEDNETITDGAGGSATSDGTPARVGANIFDVNVKLDWTTGEERGYFSDEGVFTRRSFVSGQTLLGNNLSQKGLADVSTTPLTLYDSTTINPDTGKTDLEPNTNYVVSVSNASSATAGTMGFIGVDASGNVTVFGQFSSTLTLSASGTNLQIVRSSGTADVVASLTPKTMVA